MWNTPQQLCLFQQYCYFFLRTCKHPGREGAETAACQPLSTSIPAPFLICWVWVPSGLLMELGHEHSKPTAIICVWSAPCSHRAAQKTRLEGRIATAPWKSLVSVASCCSLLLILSYCYYNRLAWAFTLCWVCFLTLCSSSVVPPQQWSSRGGSKVGVRVRMGHSVTPGCPCSPPLLTLTPLRGWASSKEQPRAPCSSHARADQALAHLWSQLKLKKNFKVKEQHISVSTQALC